MLIVELVRQEMQSSGDWGPEAVTPALTSQLIPPWPSGQKKNDYRNYADWAATPRGWIDVMQPLFYTVVKGDGWHLPGEQVVAGPGAAPQAIDPKAKPLDDNAIRPAFNPEKPPTDMTTAEKQKLAEYRKQKAKEAADRAKANRPQRPSRPGPGGPPEGGPGGPGGRGGPGGFAPNDNARPAGRPVGPPRGLPGPGSPEGMDPGIGPGPEGGMEGSFAPPPNPSVSGAYP